VSSPQKKRGAAARTFAFGTLVGGMIAVAAPRLRRGLHPDADDGGDGLSAFEKAPCWEYDREHDGGGK
jgi:hypothetical protein